MSIKSITEELVSRGEDILRGPKGKIVFTNNNEADALLNNLTEYPHAFVLACIMDRQFKAEKAWLIPFYLRERLGGNFSISKLSQISKDEMRDLFVNPNSLHRFADIMSSNFYSGVKRIADHYSGDAARIWSGNPSSADVVYRFLEFEGVGPKIATMATNILVRDFKIKLADYSSIDISADIHVRRVFHRLGLCRQDATVEQIVYKARAMNPQFPGIMDGSCWEIGRNWCGSKKMECKACYMNGLCPQYAA